jgi:dTMP kinase
LNHAGVLVSFEGIDASGKNTQSRLLYGWLRSKGVPVELLSFPDYSTPIGREIRAFLSRKRNYSLEARHILYSANRYEHKDEIESWLQDSERIVVVNRYCDSNIAYGVAGGLPLEWLKQIESRMPQVDYVIYLKATPELSVKRKRQRDRFETDQMFLKRVSEVYRALAEDRSWFSIDAEQSVQTIHYEVTKTVEALLAERSAKRSD